MDNPHPDDWTIPSTEDTASFVVDGMDFRVLDLSVSPRHDIIGCNTPMQTTHVCATIKATDIPDDDDDKRAAVDIVVALDVSDSMAGKKLALCKATLELLVRTLTAKDRFGLVVYGSRAKTIVPTTFATAEMKRVAVAKIKALHTWGCTNLSAGLTLAAQEMKAIVAPNQVRSIFLLTDGHANDGITDTPSLVTMVRNFAVPDANPPTSAFQNIQLEAMGHMDGSASLGSKPKNITVETDPPVSLHCFGYGHNHRSDMLQEMAGASPGGTYYFVDSDSNVLSAFGDAMGGILSVVAQSAVLTVLVPPSAAAAGVSIVKVHHGETIKRENGSYTITIGDFYAEETRDVLFEITLAGGSNGSSSPVPHAIVSLSYTDTVQKTTCSAGPMVCAVARPASTDVSNYNVEVETQWLRIRSVHEMREADREAQNNEFDAARSRLVALKDSIAALPLPVRQAPLTVNLLEDIEEVAAGFSTRATYLLSGCHTVQSKSMYLTRQRCCESSVVSSNAYRTTKKSKMSTDFSS